MHCTKQCIHAHAHMDMDMYMCIHMCPSTRAACTPQEVAYVNPANEVGEEAQGMSSAVSRPGGLDGTNSSRLE